MHDHDHTLLEEESDHVLWARDRLRYTSVGIDIGTATTQVVFTDIEMRRLGREMSSRFVPVAQTVLYASPIVFTPYLNGHAGIDAEAVAAFLRECYASAGQRPEDVLAGVVLLTGNALLQRNARRLAESIAKVQGDFVCHGAGHDMEARISAHGSGAIALSGRRGVTVLNVDIGGGTTKLAIVKDGTVIRTAAVGVGSRCILTDATGTVVAVDEAAAAAADRLGLDLHVGSRSADTTLTAVAREMLAGVGEVIRGGNGRRSAPLLTERFAPLGFDVVIASGGVAEYLVAGAGADVAEADVAEADVAEADVAEADVASADVDHHDLGRFLARAFGELIEDLGKPAHVAASPIRATVLGSARDAVQLSGNTIFVSDPGVLPRRNVPVIEIVDSRASGRADANASKRLVDARADAIAVAGAVAFAIDWPTSPTQRQLLDAVQRVISSVRHLPATPVVVLVLAQDIAHIIGQITKHEIGLPNELVCIDGIATEGLDYIDVAGLDSDTGTVQVTMKSLLFGAVQRREVATQ